MFLSLLQALKNAGVTEVVLAINYQPQVRFLRRCLLRLHVLELSVTLRGFPPGLGNHLGNT